MLRRHFLRGCSTSKPEPYSSIVLVQFTGICYLNHEVNIHIIRYLRGCKWGAGGAGAGAELNWFLLFTVSRRYWLWPLLSRQKINSYYENDNCPYSSCWKSMLQSNPEFSLLLLYHIIVGGRTPPCYNFIISRKIHPNNIRWYSAPSKGMGGLGQNKLFWFILIYVIALSLFFQTLGLMFLNNEDFLFCERLMLYR